MPVHVTQLKSVSADLDVPVADVQSKWHAAKTKSDMQSVPLWRQSGVHNDPVLAHPHAGEPIHEGLPEPTHRRQMQAAGSAAGEIVQIDPGGDPLAVMRSGSAPAA